MQGRQLEVVEAETAGASGQWDEAMAGRHEPQVGRQPRLGRRQLGTHTRRVSGFSPLLRQARNGGQDRSLNYHYCFVRVEDGWREGIMGYVGADWRDGARDRKDGGF